MAEGRFEQTQYFVMNIARNWWIVLVDREIP